MANNHNGHLRLFSMSKVSTPVTNGHFACNPVVDLTATVGEGNELYIWRANGQVVSRHTERNQKVDAIKWKEDGQFLVAGWSDGVVRLVGLESSKAVHHIRVGDGATSRVDFIAWSRNVTGKRPATRSSSAAVGQLPSRSIVLDDDDDKKDILDLPHELTFLEIETTLPKISPLPVSGGSGDDMFIFSTTSSLDFVFRPCKTEDADIVHVMIAGTTDGNIHLSIYDSFVIGSFKHTPRTAKGPVGSGGAVFHLSGHGSHPDISTHSLLLRQKGGDGKMLYLVPLDLTFVYDSPVNLSLLASKMTTLQNLLRYVKQTQSHMMSEWKSTRELPARFLSSVQEDLQKMPKGPVTVVQALCHTVATGHVFPPLKEWLVDSLAERGHKRWDKAVISGLENLRGLVHENLIPALERCGIVLSRLLGIARFHGSRESIGFTATQITKLMDIVSCLTVVAHKILLNVMDELEHFTSFSTWLRMEIDELASSTMTEELTEKEATLDNAKVLTYIQRYLVNSPLALFLDDVAKEDYNKDLELAEDGHSLLQLLDRQLQRNDVGLPYMKALPHLDFLVNYLTGRAGAVFKDIAEAEKRSIRFGQATEISIGQKIWKHDVFVCPRHQKTGVDSGAFTFTAFVSDNDKNNVYIYRTSIPIINGISGTATTSACGLALPKDATVIDLNYLDNQALLVLCNYKDESKPVLLRIVYQSAHVPYSDYKEGQAPNMIKLEAQDAKGVCSSYTFSQMSGFTPVQMEVRGGSHARGNVPAKVCLLGRDKVTYKMYAIPEDWSSTEAAAAAGSQMAPSREDVTMEGSQPY
ncbi:anaphase-promoting complex, cyclosome, subunit 4-domain-containing protein [Bombardia bombarda]|uniref:Anaphase-promoting complex subunit 4 n=1 Tax=Bombardia bombarda TaxID=252184 RepID=A0AA40C0Z2_9PEZI|nr:anaphase-promoting complex, cyclosome, subunit 4-domain-containing protein [Bombardia bombarda]